jgi:hypothetical protein
MRAKGNAALPFRYSNMWKKYSINDSGKLWEIVLFCVKFR